MRQMIDEAILLEIAKEYKEYRRAYYELYNIDVNEHNAVEEFTRKYHLRSDEIDFIWGVVA